MKLLDRLGLNASRINTKLLKLVGDVKTIDFSDVLYTDGTLEDTIVSTEETVEHLVKADKDHSTKINNLEGKDY